MSHPHPSLTACAVAVALACWVSAAAAQSLTLSNFVVDDQLGSLTARFGIALDDVAGVSDLLRDGNTLALKCRARLERPGGFWHSKRLAEAELVSRLKYDALTREYVLRLPGREAPLKNPHLDDLLRSGWSSLRLGMGSWRRLRRGQEYELNLDIRLRRVDIPNWFRRTLLFWTWDVIPETSYRLTFRY